MLIEALAIGGLGLASALGLGVAARVFAVEVDPLVEKVEGSLAGANCGGCGYASCAQAAVAVASGKAPANLCVAGGPAVAAAVAAIMGVTVEYREPEVAKVDCTYGTDKAELKFQYEGVHDCRAAVLMAGGPKICDIGCVGLGSCAKACPFDAISMENNLPKVDPNKCTGCGTCVRVCPKFIIHLDNVTNRILGFNSDYNCLAPCQNRCPAEIDIPAYIKAIADGRYEDAVATIKEHNPLPLVCGRVCPHPCEYVCRRGLDGDAVNINHLKRFAADYELNSGQRVQPLMLPKNNRKVAVIGGGPAGLSCAYYLARLGYSPTIFEAQPYLGGMLRYGIPEYRLPKKTLDWEIQGILDLGCEVRLNQSLGKDFNLEDLRQEGFEAIFIGVGAWGFRSMRLDGEDLDGVRQGTPMLVDRGNLKDTPIGDRVMIVGGGNTAMDCARTCWRLGAKEVIVIYRRGRAEMPAEDFEVQEAMDEGVKFLFLANPTRLIGDENGRLKAVEYVTMELGEPDASGRRRPVPKEGSETIIEVDNVIAAIGQFPDLECLDTHDSCKEVARTKWNEVQGDRAGATNIPGVFTGGDCSHGAATVVQAIGAARKAARGIHFFLSGRDHSPDAHWIKDWKKVQTRTQIPMAPEPGARVKMPDLHVPERVGNFNEVELGLTREMAQAESQRCLQCGLICYQGCGKGHGEGVTPCHGCQS